ncbi:hypothetical protein H5410_063553 [Solanum commersonii]|uniref:DUF1985 domain-containing protein n=1 Tax=Solanum commersonii TaxID=4109 RepID=A0A9J5WDJ3_SOLCO|nr:hypothetical protein H5410_063553 [Solanum commersonii]
MPIDEPTNLTGDFVVKSVMGAKFDAFRTILMKEKLEDFFKSSCFGYFLDLPEANNARFQMSMVYDLLKRRIKYKGDDDDALKDKNKKMDEIWINYCGMLICFGMKEFSIVTGLRCHPSSEPLPKVARLRKSREKEIFKSIKIGKKGKKPVKTVNAKTNKGKEKLNNKNEFKKVLKKHKERLCLVWFVHAILWAKDINNVIDLSLFVFAQDLDAFNNYPWGNDSYFLTVEYLVSKLSPKTNNLYGFPWTFLVNFTSNFSILLEHLKQYLISGSSTDDLFVATDRSYIGRNLNLLLLFCFCPIIYRSVAIDGSSIEQNLNKCKNKEAQLISTGEDVKKSLDALTSVVKKLISKRCVIPSRKISESFTPLKIKRRRKSISKILSKRQQIATTPLPCNVESSSRAIKEQQKL